jgi:hypothetical protein
MRNDSLPALSVVYCVVLIFLGAFFLLNLVLAVVMESYMESEISEGLKLTNELEEEKKKLEERAAQFKNEQEAQV